MMKDEIKEGDYIICNHPMMNNCYMLALVVKPSDLGKMWKIKAFSPDDEEEIAVKFRKITKAFKVNYKTKEDLHAIKNKLIELREDLERNQSQLAGNFHRDVRALSTEILVH